MVFREGEGILQRQRSRWERCFLHGRGCCYWVAILLHEEEPSVALTVFSSTLGGRRIIGIPLRAVLLAVGQATSTAALLEPTNG